MGQPIARVSDPVFYTCVIGSKLISGTGSITSGSPDTNLDKLSIARDGDMVDCGPCGLGVIRASGTTKVNSRGVALLGDQVTLPTGSGTIVGASQTGMSS
jgi:uncharacterized Zn-binding protein involved in type VI secretion